MKTITQYVISCTMLLTMLFGFSEEAHASHFRHGTMSWSPAPVPGSPYRIQFKLNVAYRGGTWTIGTSGYGESMNYGDGTSEYVTPIVTGNNATEDWFYATAVFYHNYPSAGNYTANWANSCCRIGSLSNNANGYYSMQTVVNVGTGNSSPISSLAPIVNLPTGASAASFQVPSNDPDGDPITFRLATGTEVAAGVSYSQPSGFAVSSSGLATFNTVGKTVGSLFAAAIVLEDGNTKTVVDFIIKITGQSTAPAFDYTATPSNGYVYQIVPGQALSFGVRATDSDPGSSVSLQTAGIPVGSSFTSTSGNPAQGNFSWTPSASNLGTSVINFTAQDNVGVQASTSVTIVVSLKPTFDVPPTPAAASEGQFEPGTAIAFTIQASDPDAQDLVQIMSVSGLPSGASLSASLPTAAGNPTSTQLSWTPQASDWGQHNLSFIAKDTYNDQKSHAFSIIVNRQPVFTSSPVTSGQANFLYSYSISSSDPDQIFGDQLAIVGVTLPSWLTLTDNGDGTATLSGTPTAAGTYNVDLFLEDIYHHDYPNPAINNAQSFVITVIDCTDPAFTSCPQNMYVGTSSGACDAVVSYSASVSGTPDPSLSYTFSGATSGSGSGTGSGATFALGTTLVTISASNSCSTASCAFYVTVIDNEPPSVSCPADQSIDLDASCSAVMPDYTALVSVSDNCGAVSVSQSPAPGSYMSGTGMENVTMTATDAAGNSSICGFQVAKMDVTAPSITCPSPMTVSSDPGQCSAVVNFSAPVTSDNCSGTTTGVNTLNYGDVFFDYHNNQFEQQYSPGLPMTFSPTAGSKMAVFLQRCGSSHYIYQNVSIPASGPSILGYDMQYYNHNGSFNNSQFVAVELRNPSTGALIETLYKTLPGYPASIAMTHFSFDLSGYAGQTVQLRIVDASIYNYYFDVLLDNITLPGSNLQNGSFETGDYTGWTLFSQSGGCGTFGIGSGLGVSAVQVAGLPSGAIFPVGTTTNVFEVTDLAGNMSSCSFDVTVEDTENPVIACSGDIHVYATSAAGASVSYPDPSASDNCAGVQVALTAGDVSGATFPIGFTTVSYMATDAAGNSSSCSFVVEVEGIAPVAVCPSDITVTNDLGICGASVPFAAVDNTGIPASTMSYTHSSGDIFPVGSTMVTATATNAIGSSSCSFQIVVIDAEAPIAMAQDVSITLSSGSASVSPQMVNNGSSDNCDIASMSVSPNTWDCDDIGDHTVTLTVTDIYGSVSTASAVVHVLGDVPSCSINSIPTDPTYTGGNPTALYLGYGAQSTTLTSLVSGGSGFSYSWSGQDLSCTSCANPVFTPSSAGSYTFTLTVTNSNGCSSSCTINICVFDIRVPKKNGKVYVCKVPPGNPSNAHTIEVSVNAVASHLATGSSLGACNKVPCGSLPQKALLAENAEDGASNISTPAVGLFPNPTSGDFQLELLSQDERAYQYFIYDMAGKLIHSGEAQPNAQEQIRLELTNGVYLVEVVQGEFRNTQRLVKH